ncbi:MAG: ATP-binding protein [Patescibacteria group bacterium]
MGTFSNLDLLSVGIVTAGIAVLGFSVFFSNRHSITNLTFLKFAVLTVCYSVANYLQHVIASQDIALWTLRLTIFFAVWHAYYFFKLFYVFPKDELALPKVFKLLLIPWVLVTSVVSLTPLVFSSISVISSGSISQIKNGPAVAIFGVTVVFLVISGVIFLLKKMFRAESREKRQYLYISFGAFVTFSLIIVFNLVLPIIFSDSRFVPLAALFFFPFVFFTSYAIIKHGLLNIKVVATEILTFILAVVTFLEIIFSEDLAQIIFRSSVFTLVLIFGIFLIKSVRREIEQRQKIEILAGELGVANSKLRELDKQKTEFLSIASHQLRAPLTAIKGYSSMLLENSFGDISEKVRGAVDVIFQSSQKLVTVIEDFLNITRIELGRMKYELAEIDLRKLVETAVKELQNQIKARGLALKVEIPEGVDFKVTADSGKIAQVIGNLIDNATKYTKQGGITISLSRPLGAGKVRLAIADTGVGMTPGAHAQLFQKFTRAKDAGKVNIIGTGLGLYVAKQIIEGHHGKIWAESAGPGQGSTFYVEL